MSPKIFIPQGEGYRIRLARSPQDDPRLKYRKEAERRATAAEFTFPAKRLLMALRDELGLSEAEAEAIEAEVLKPHRDYQRKRQEYQETLHHCLESESPLSQRTIADLRDYRAHLRLKPEDVATIERAALNGHDLEGYVAELERQRQAQAQRQQQEAEAERQQQEAEAERNRQVEAQAQRQQEEAERQKQANEDDLSSEKGIDYTRLRDLLKAGQWRDADKETYAVMIRAVGKKSGEWFSREELLNFPCTDLRTIDGLWVKYSQGKFGFSVQKQIYVECGAQLDGEYPGDKIWHEFCDRVGWRKGGKYLNYSDLKADLSLSPTGEFPGFGGLGSFVFWVWPFGGRLGSSLASRLVNCSR
jgi:hypothetical protein